MVNKRVNVIINIFFLMVGFTMNFPSHFIDIEMTKTAVTLTEFTKPITSNDLGFLIII